MSTFKCPVVRVAEVVEHPNADRLSIVRLDGLGYTCISAKLEDGSSRYKPGDLVVYIPSAAVLPEWLLKVMDFWNEETNKGMLAGSNGDRVKPLRLRGIFSEGLLYPVQTKVFGVPMVDGRDQSDSVSFLVQGLDTVADTVRGHRIYARESYVWTFSCTPLGLPGSWMNYKNVSLGQDASDILGITKYEPPIPVNMAGEVANLSSHTVKYDFERLENVPDMFAPGEQVVATEKLHGTFCAIGYVPDLNHPEMFGANGDIIVHSKGLGGQGLAFKNNEANAGNLYVRTLRNLLANHDLEARLAEVSRLGGGQPVYVMGEIFGRGVQDLHYGTKEPEFRVFEIRIGHDYLPRDQFGFGHLDSQTRYGGTLGLDAVPILYHGPFDVAALEKVRDGRTMLGGENIREGIVVRSLVEGRHDMHGRKVAKMISPDYLLRKVKGGEATEYT